MTVAAMEKTDKRIIWYFVAFFATFMIVDAIFVTVALKTERGLVTDQAYEKGLAFNQTLEEARNQEKFVGYEKAEYNKGRLMWVLKDANGRPMKGAKVMASLVRPVQAGYDFDLPLTEGKSGVYSARPEFPLPGQWTAKLEVTWNSKVYRSILPLVVTDTSLAPSVEKTAPSK